MKTAVVLPSLVLVLAAAPVSSRAVPEAAQAARPNIVVFLTDDQGYGDLSMNGHPTINTPNIDRLATEGLRLTSLYGAPNCTPSRGMFFTGRYPPRTGLLSPTGPGHPSGIQASEITMAEALKAQGYRTAMFGKWHMGDFEANPAFNPTAHGFDVFLGIPYSHDYNPPEGVPLFRGTQIAERPVRYATMTQRFTEEAVRFIADSAGQPFFIYIAHPMPHIPLGTSERFRGRSRAGRYGDVIEELDWSVGEVQAALRERGLDQNTITIYMSDNGPWVTAAGNLYERGERGTKVQGDVGWTGLLRGAKQSTWEGGMRVPGVIRWPAQIPAGQRAVDMVSTMDWYPTLLGAAGASVPTDRPIDGMDVLPLLKGTGPSPRTEFFYFAGANLQAVRQGPWKLRVEPLPGEGRGASGRAGGAQPAGDGAQAAGAQQPTSAQPGGGQPTGGPAGRGGGAVVAVPPTPGVPQLFNLDTDPAERYDVAAAHSEIVTRLQSRMETFGREVARQTPAR